MSSTERTMSEHLIIFDTTLRDGEQSPGASMNLNDKVRIARVLEKMRVDIIEAGFPIASPGDFESVKAVAEAIKDSRVCGLARATVGDIERAAEAIKPANASRIHTFLATSPIHMKEKLRMTSDQVLEQITFAVSLARNHTDDVEFSPEDASRTEPDFLCRAVETAIHAGATTINIPDTVGYAWPEEFAQSIANLIERVPNSDKAIFSVHCHDDLGLSVSNSLQAVLKGARQIECTINGLGERAGNASLEEVVMAVRTRQDIFPVDTRINTKEIMSASRLVSSITGFPVQPNKAIVGANAFAHESGIHQDGVIKKRETYEIMRAEDVGWDTNKMVLGKHSGRNAFKTRLRELGFEFSSDDELKSAFGRFKELADKKHQVFDDDLQALISEEIAKNYQDKYRLISLSANSAMDKSSSAKVAITDGDTVLNGNATGDGPVDAAFKAIKSMLDAKASLLLYSVNNITSGTDSLGEVTVRLKDGSRIVNGLGSDTDIVVASAKAYVAALNKLANSEMRFHPQNEILV
jgi:2-isopropylmalate synthase